MNDVRFIPLPLVFSDDGEAASQPVCLKKDFAHSALKLIPVPQHRTLL